MDSFWGGSGIRQFISKKNAVEMDATMTKGNFVGPNCKCIWHFIWTSYNVCCSIEEEVCDFDLWFERKFDISQSEVS